MGNHTPFLPKQGEPVGPPTTRHWFDLQLGALHRQ